MEPPTTISGEVPHIWCPKSELTKKIERLRLLVKDFLRNCSKRYEIMIRVFRIVLSSFDDSNRRPMKRPRIPEELILSSQLIFFLLDCCSTISNAIRSGVFSNADSNAKLHSIIKLICVTSCSQSVCCNVYDYYPRFYVYPYGISAPDFTRNTEALNELIRVEFQLKYKNGCYVEYLQTCPAIISMEICELENIPGYCSGSSAKKLTIKNAVKVTCSLPKFTSFVARIFQQGFFLSEKESYHRIQCLVVQKSNSHEESFMEFFEMPSTCWLKLDEFSYFIRNTGQLTELSSCCSFEVDVNYRNVKVLPYKLSSLNMLPPLRILSFDIEVQPNDIFPRHGTTGILQIGNILGTYGLNIPKTRIVFVMGQCDDIDGTEVRCFNDEATLLESWRSFVLEADPDVLTGYNILGFDLPYLIERSVGISENFRYLGRLKNIPVVIGETFYNRPGDFVMNECEIIGRIILDTYKLAKCSGHRLLNYSLKNIAMQYLGYTKMDLSYTDIPRLQESGAKGRSILAQYCLKDAELAYDLLMSQETSNFNLASCFALSSCISLKKMIFAKLSKRNK